MRAGFAGELVPGGMQGDVTLWHNVGPAKSHQEVNVGCPFADAFELCELGFDLRVIKGLQPVEVDAPFDHGFGEVTGIRGLLPAEAVRSQLLIGALDQTVRRQLANPRRKLIKTGHGRRQRHLLFEDDLQERRETLRAVPKRRRTVRLKNQREMWIGFGQHVAGSMKALFAKGGYRAFQVFHAFQSGVSVVKHF